METKERKKLVHWFKTAVNYEELNLVEAQNKCLADWYEIFPANSPSGRRGEEILNKLILDSMNHAIIFAGLIIKIYDEELRKFQKALKS